MKSKFMSADQAVRTYFELEASLASPRAQSLGEKGPVPVAACTYCGHAKSQRSVSKTKGTRLTCVRCGRAWKIEIKWQPMDRGKRSNPPRLAETHLKIDLGVCLHTLPLWQRRVLEVLACWDVPGRRIDGVTAYCAQTWPRRLGGWSARIVRELVDGPPGRPRLGARSRLEAALARAELLDLEGRALRRAMGE